MKTFIIYIEGHEKSTQSAQLAYDSCKNLKYEPTLYKGITPKTLAEAEKGFWLEYTVMKPSHMYDRQTGKNGTRYTYQCKYSNFLNHYKLWHKCVSLDETIVILEHDALAVGEWKNPEFQELLVLNIHSGLYNEEFSTTKKPELFTGVHEYINPYLNYKAKNLWLDAGMIPGTAAYAITPKGAKRLIDNVLKHGWDKADYIINTKSVFMEYVYPDYFEFSHKIIPNQRTSHGE